MILVTGATGNVGRELTEQLLQSDQAMRILTRDPGKVPAWQGRLEVAVGDLAKAETLDAAFKDVGCLFLVTASTEQDENALRAAKKAGVQHLVKLSTFEAVDPLMTEHVKWHREREELIRASGLAWTFLRPTMFMSTALDWAKTIRQDGTFQFPGGAGKVPAVDPWDVAAVARVALTTAGHEGRAYALTGPKALSFSEMAQILSEVLGKPVHYADMPEQEAREMMRHAGLPDYVIDGLAQTFLAIRTHRLEYTTDDVQRVTGRPPRTFEVWCREHRAAFE